MENRKIKYFFVSLFVALAIILCFIILNGKNQSLRVIFLDVGQGDAILIEQGNNQILIDGGKDGTLLLEKIGKYIPFWDRKIEMVIETHPDQDHVGGFPDLMKAYQVESVLKTQMKSQSQTFRRLEELVDDKNSEIIKGISGQTIKFDGGGELSVIFPLEKVSENSTDTNASSVVTRLNFGENRFLFTGDLPMAQEKIILEKKIDIKADVLKVSHHGSKSASSDDFLTAVDPVEAVISVGKQNSYGHPNEEVLKRLTQHNIKYFRTDEAGDIVYECPSMDEKCQRVD